jgi:hypothetical protein
LWASTVEAQYEEENKRPKAVKDRISLLENQVDKLAVKLQDVTGGSSPNALRVQIREIREILDKLVMEVHETDTKAKAEGKQQDERLDDIAEELSSLWKKSEEVEAAIKDLQERPMAGYEDGFCISSSDRKFQLIINGFVRPYYRAGFQKQWYKNRYYELVRDENGKPRGGDTTVVENDFGVANARLAFNARVLDVLRGTLSIDFGNLSGEVQYPLIPHYDLSGVRYNRVDINEYSLRLLDAYGEYVPMEEISIRVGQFKVPFDRETSLFYANQLTFTSRSLMTRRYVLFNDRVDPDQIDTFNWDYDTSRGSSFGYDRGLALRGKVSEGIFRYSAGIFNGGGPNAGNDNRDVLIAARLASDILGEMPEGMSDLDVSKKALLSIGAGLAYDLPAHKHPTDINKTYNSSDFSITADAHFKFMGASVMFAFFYRHADHGNVFVDSSGNDKSINSLGLTPQVSYYIEKIKLEPAIRYSLYDADVDLADDHVHELTGAINYYPYPEHLKVSLEYRGVYPQDPGRSYLAPFNGWYDYLHEIAVMAQFAF